MAKNTVTNAKTAARKFLSAVVNGVKGKAGGKDTADPVTVKVKTVKAGDKDGKGQTVKVTAVKGKADKDAADTPAVPKGKKGKKKADLSTPRKQLGKADRKALHKAVNADLTSTATNTAGRGAARANVFGHSASAVWRAVGYKTDRHGDYVYTLSDCRAVRDALGLGGVITDGNVKCQFSDGRYRKANDVAPDDVNGGFYGGKVADLSSKDWAVIDSMVKAARTDD